MRLTWQRYLPLSFFGVTYLLTCYAGAILLLAGPPSARFLYKIYAGIDVPSYSQGELFTLIALLHFPLVCLGAGYFFGMKIVMGKAGRRFKIGTFIGEGVIFSAWGVSALLALVSVWRGDAIANISAWVTSYDYWVSARWTLFATLSTPAFINLYVFLPVTSALAMVHLWQQKKTRQAAWVFGLGFVLSLLLFQKKQPIVYLFVVSMPFWLARLSASDGKMVARKIWVGLLAALIGVYLALFIIPTLELSGVKQVDAKSVSRGDFDFVEALQELAGKPEPVTELDFFMASYMSLPSPIRIALFTGNSILFRTSAPAMYYPLVFPAKHPFYGLDLPFDHFTAGDNLVVWREMWPNTPGGSVTVPFHFALYAQAGLAGALCGALAFGAFLGALWAWFVNVKTQTPVTLVGGAVILMFAIFLAIDSGRNSIIASYGLAWGGMLLLLLVGISRFRPSRGLS